MDKSIATPINCSPEDIALVQQVLACRIEHFPTRYLGVPLSVYKLKRSEEQPLLDAVASRIPKWRGNLLNLAGQSTLVAATLSAIPIHMSIALCLSPWAIERIDRRRQAFIWCGSESVAAGRCRVAWDMVMRPRALGGLGITDLQRAGVALRTRWAWLERTDPDRVWSGLPRIKERKVVALFNAAVTAVLGNGRSILFWTDRWLDGSCLPSMAPSLFAAVSRRKLKASVAKALPGNAWARHVTGALTMPVLTEFVQVWERLQQVQLLDSPDTFVRSLSPDHKYSSASAYGAMFLGSSAPVGAKQIWKTSAPPKVKFFF